MPNGDNVYEAILKELNLNFDSHRINRMRISPIQTLPVVSGYRMQ